jgi:hypothetical protein
VLLSAVLVPPWLCASANRKFLSFQKQAPALTFTPLKKIAIILLIGLYGLSASGMAVQLHYCCGKVASVSLGYQKSSKAGCKHGSMKKTMPGCCNDQQVSIDVDDDQGLAAGAIVPSQPDLEVPAYQVTIPTVFTSANSTSISNIRGSPPNSSVPIYLFNQVFRN